jgi:hypothetical protein
MPRKPFCKGSTVALLMSSANILLLSVGSRKNGLCLSFLSLQQKAVSGVS